MVVFALILVLVLLLLCGLLWAGGGKTIQERRGSGIIEAMPDSVDEVPTTPATLTVLSYDIAYGLGAAGERAPPAAAIYDRLEAIVETIAASGAEVALLRQVDFASRRTYDNDQLSYIAAALGWRFVARATTWECRYLPYPLWPPTRHAGRVRAGMGVISRYPLVQNTRQRLSQPRSRSQPLLSPLFAPYHTVQMVDVECGQHRLRLLHVGLETRERATRQRQAEELVAFVREVATPTCVLIGAFASAVPERGGGRAPEQTLATVVEALHDCVRLVPMAGAASPVVASRAGADHALIGAGLQAVEIEVMAPGESVSDHLPLLLRLRWLRPVGVGPRRNTHEHP